MAPGRQFGSSMTVMSSGSAATSCSVLVPTGSMTRPRLPMCSAVVPSGSTASPGPIAAADVPAR